MKCSFFVSQLEAKWLLEHQLAQNRARRAREAAEFEVASNKRTLETATEGLSVNSQAQQTEDNSAKKIKVQHSPSDTAVPPEESREESTKNAQSLEHDQKIEDKVPDVDKLDTSTAEETDPEPKELDRKESSRAADIQEKKGKGAENISQKQNRAPAAQESTELNEQPDQTVSDGDMNFESMFGDANADNDQNNDMNFDLDLNPDNLNVSNPFDSTSHNASNLELLPGLESYANASGDDFNMLNLPSTTTGDQIGTGAVKNNSSDLPEIQGDSNFNELFADGDFGGDASLMDLDLEDGFFNT